MTGETTTDETEVPPGESPAECPYCGRPLESEELLVLHEGIDHWDRLDDDRREAFRETYQRENDDLRTFRLKLLGLLVLVYFVFLFVYSVETTDPYSVVAVIPV
ncbi:C2H2-type zinc finger protein [Halorussus sp. MSC15.2]|uniref:C2H2-type zinc finger protein n=1 Tax=Halorussus sp. MSC15.2 TaxID=2283638 RepID=UPI0013D2C211|nr:C2H2-type zinc finger protein [Halorussus sp. MSC15.2]NEU56650.1 C2H2-type zinc finger protein [Halorussus sp. MSC15.2]